MLSEARIAIDHVRLPQDRREVLRRPSNGSHREGLLILIVGVVEVVLALSEVDDLHFVVGHEEEVGRLDVAVADALALHEGTRRDQAAVHPHQLRLAPE